jgi:hypothetical protein
MVLSRAPLGLAAPEVRVEVHLGPGLPAFALVGLPEAVVRESRRGQRSALLTTGFEFPAGRITVNLSPADLPKEGGRSRPPHCRRHPGRQPENPRAQAPRPRILWRAIVGWRITADAEAAAGVKGQAGAKAHYQGRQRDEHLAAGCI